MEIKYNFESDFFEGANNNASDVNISINNNINVTNKNNNISFHEGSDENEEIIDLNKFNKRKINIIKKHLIFLKNKN
jgi:hypothetical protein